jgi:hypothetical protein
MPFTSVLGASSVIKPGVCTSSTRPTAPYVGQLVFETDTNRLVVFTASGWVYETASNGPPGLVHITSGSFTSASSVNLPANTFTSTYRNYRVMFDITAQTGSVSLTMRIRSSGSDITTARYFQMSTGIDTASSASNQVDFATSSWTLVTTIAFSPTAPFSLVMDVKGPQIASVCQYALGNLTAQAVGGQFIGRSFNAVFNPSTAQTYDSLSLISSVASSISGVFRVYGYADS